MNPELQAQTDAMVKAISQLETTLHQDAVLLMGLVSVLMIVLLFITLFRRR
jgi:predicted RND superfamily exporter protein